MSDLPMSVNLREDVTTNLWIMSGCIISGTEIRLNPYKYKTWNKNLFNFKEKKCNWTKILVLKRWTLINKKPLILEKCWFYQKLKHIYFKPVLSAPSWLPPPWKFNISGKLKSFRFKVYAVDIEFSRRNFAVSQP